MTKKTKCAPGERLASNAVETQHDSLSLHACSSYFNFFPLPLIVVNSHRQIVLSNKAFTEALGLKNLTSILGKRPGEAMGCIYSAVQDEGCGTDEHCRECGALLAVLESINKNTDADRECHLLIETPQGVNARDFRVYASPWETEDGTHYVVSIVDISDKKRREVLERVFFHDILNAVGGAQGIANLLLEEASDGMKDMVTLMRSSLFGLAEEISKQKEMVAVEQNEYSIKPITLQAAEIMQALADEFQTHPKAIEKHVMFDDTSENVAVKADYTLLRRVIINMIVNALEASEDGHVVKLGVRDEGGFARLWVHNESTMPESVQLQVFKRSFSTKGEGRGLGTYSIKLLSENYLDGRVGFFSTDKGTTFWVELPESKM